MNEVCQVPVRWDLDGVAELWCEADRPCPYHDRNGLTDAQRIQWRRDWANREVGA